MFKIYKQIFFQTYFYLRNQIYFDWNVEKVTSHKYILGPH
jgi:hypothetical protein